MACSVKIGRFGANLQDVGIDALRLAGDTLTIDGTLEGTAEIVEAQVEQLLGLVDNPDELFIPVTWDAPMSRLDGYYRVQSADADSTLRLAGEARYPWRAVLQRVQGFANPTFESVVIGGPRTSSNLALVTPRPWHGMPNVALGYDVPGQLGGGDSLATETGTVTIYSQTADTYLYNGRPTWFVPPAAWYAGACSLQINGKTVIGRQPQNQPAGWVVSNGAVRFLPAVAGGFQLERWDGSSWLPAGIWLVGQLQGTTGTDFGEFPAPHTISVRRNDPACVTIRLTSAVAQFGSTRRRVAYMDLSIRRGSQTFVVTIDTGDTDQRIAFQAPIPFATRVSGQDITADLTGLIAACGTSNLAQSAVVTGGTQFVHAAGGFAQFGWGGYSTTDRIARFYAADQAERTEVVAR